MGIEQGCGATVHALAGRGSAMRSSLPLFSWCLPSSSVVLRIKSPKLRVCPLTPWRSHTVARAQRHAGRRIHQVPPTTTCAKTAHPAPPAACAPPSPLLASEDGHAQACVPPGSPDGSHCVTCAARRRPRADGLAWRGVRAVTSSCAFTGCDHRAGRADQSPHQRTGASSRRCR